MVWPYFTTTNVKNLHAPCLWEAMNMRIRSQSKGEKMWKMQMPNASHTWFFFNKRTLANSVHVEVIATKWEVKALNQITHVHATKMSMWLQSSSSVWRLLVYTWTLQCVRVTRRGSQDLAIPNIFGCSSAPAVMFQPSLASAVRGDRHCAEAEDILK